MEAQWIVIWNITTHLPTFTKNLNTNILAPNTRRVFKIPVLVNLNCYPESANSTKLVNKLELETNC